ncbi:MAG: hypothetical protein HQQ73_06030 [Desulfobulbaceae bacterium]|nr:hypothetical protein [Desulfobulbaceae bacterium]
MKRAHCGFFVFLFLSVCLLAGCGYYFPHMYEGPERVVYMPNWENRTNKLGLDNRIYQSLSRWFQKSDVVKLTKERTNADYILAGEIVDIDLPSVSWDGVTRATGINVKLIVRYVLKDLNTGEIVWEVPGKLYTADYTEKRVSAAGDEIALREIVDDISEEIYLGTLHRIRRQLQAAPDQTLSRK